ncbi:hypothetical protein COCMIDRAFT_98558, partial [Bipolaris oryzae ATCC 44560]
PAMSTSPSLPISPAILRASDQRPSVSGNCQAHAHACSPAGPASESLVAGRFLCLAFDLGHTEPVGHSSPPESPAYHVGQYTACMVVRPWPNVTESPSMLFLRYPRMMWQNALTNPRWRSPRRCLTVSGC